LIQFKKQALIQFVKLIGLLLFIVAACNEHIDRPNIDFTYDPESITKLESRVASESDSLISPLRIEIFDNYAVVGDVRSSIFLHLFDLETGRKLQSFGKIGRGPGEFQNIQFLQFHPDSLKLYAHDASLSRTSVFRFKPDIQLFDYDTLLQIKNDGLTIEVSAMNDGRLVTNGMIGNKRVAIFNKNGEYLYDIGKLPGQLNESFNARMQAHRTFSEFHFKTGNIILGNMNSDLIEIWSPENEKIKEVRGPIGKDPVYRFQENGHSFQRTDETITSYVGITSNDKYIVGLYSGRTKDQDYDNMGSYIHVLDADGNFINSYRLDYFTFDIDLGKDNKLYSIVSTRIPTIREYIIPQ